MEGRMTEQEIMKGIRNRFLQFYGTSDTPLRLFYAPGRVNLIGEHTDYNGGYVLPCALDRGTYLMLRRRPDDILNLRSLNCGDVYRLKLSDIEEKKKNDWVDYPLGVLNQFWRRGCRIEGLDMLWSGYIPSGAGLSSSASIEMVTAVGVNETFGFNMSRMELIMAARAAENDFVGVDCGIMDQFASGLGSPEHAVFINCKTLEYEMIPFQLKDFSIVLCNSNKPRSLAESKYNERVKECREAVEMIRSFFPVDDLSDLTMERFTTIKSKLPLPHRKRVAHVVAENRRTLDAVNALKKKDMIRFGGLMEESHHSLRYDYEVTGPELDILATEAMRMKGVAGARMTGAGFGGCTVNLVRRVFIEEFRRKMEEVYEKKTGRKTDIYVTETGSGAGEIET